MFRSYLISAFRNLFKNKGYTLINILGLSTGLASCILILAFVMNELQYDCHHRNADNLYRLIFKGQMGGNYIEAATTGGSLGQVMKDEIPEVVNYTRMIHFPRSVLLEYNDKKFYQEHILYTDSTFFELFRYDFVAGNPEAALTEPNCMVLTESTANKYFGDEDPMGKMIRWNDDKNMVVKGIVKDPEYPSHLHFDLLVSHVTLYDHPVYKRFIDNNFSFVTYNYLHLVPGVELKDIDTKIAAAIDKYMGEDMKAAGLQLNYFIQPVVDIHLHSHLTHEIQTNGDITNVYIFSGIALLILIIASINFINLTTSRSSKRAVEVGLRKLFGANRRMLFAQFLGETVVISILSLALAVIIANTMIPVVESLTASRFEIHLFGQPYFYYSLAGFLIFILAMAGIYPSVFIASFSPMKVLKKNISLNRGNTGFMNAMIILQFIITVFLLSSTLVIYNQLHYMKNKNLGVDIDNTVVIGLRNGEMVRDYESYRNEFMNINGVDEVTAFSAYIGNFQQRRGYYPEDQPRDNMWMIRNIQVTRNYFDVMEVPILEGRGFSENPSADSLHIIVNKALVKEMGWEDPIGKYIAIPLDNEGNEIRYRVIGVTSDFHYASMHEKVEPLIISHEPGRIRYMSLKLNSGASANLLSEISDQWETMNPNYPFEYFFLDEKYSSAYKNDMRMAEVFTSFTYLAVFIACLGLFGLVSFMAARKTKEIGIRKVLGATVGSISGMFARIYFRLILIASVIALPLTWFAMTQWIDNFVYHTHLGWWIFIVSTIAVLIISLITVVLRAYAAATKNPVDAIRYE